MKIKLLGNQYLPEYKTCGAAGADLHAHGDWNIKPNETLVIPVGVCFEIPAGYEVQIRPRSGLSRHGLICTVGTVDSDYRGEVGVIIHNFSTSMFAIRDGDRIAQMVYAPVVQAEFEIADELSETKRGTHGFGSTGV
jgi:dUTP pyrophosphatase